MTDPDPLTRLDAVAALMTFKGTAENLANLDIGYAPPFATAMDPVIHAANLLRNKIDGTAETISVSEVKELLASDDDFVIIDVRSAPEFEKLCLEDKRLLKIPLEELRNRTGELPKDKKAIVLCKAGPRSYEAYLALKGAGFKDPVFVEGGLAAWGNSGE